ncbi:hypothetical protein NY929_22960, partial [Escherichia coli]|uniref:hypothetical protein n=1 Tax=Escherichia coli TaxID=562 RepID=UPI0022F01D68
SVYHACVADFFQLEESKDKECDGQPPQYALVQAGKPGKVSYGCLGGMAPITRWLAELPL